MSRTFKLMRREDVSGVSGTGFVAEGAEFTDGSVALRWLGDYPSTAVWASLDLALKAHGHQGKTVVVWDDEPATTPLARVAALHPSGLPALAVQYIRHENRTDVHVLDRDGWLQWIVALGGSPDAAVRVEFTKDSDQWRWMTPDGRILVFYLIPKEGS